MKKYPSWTIDIRAGLYWNLEPSVKEMERRQQSIKKKRVFPIDNGENLQPIVMLGFTQTVFQQYFGTRNRGGITSNIHHILHGSNQLFRQLGWERCLSFFAKRNAWLRNDDFFYMQSVVQFNV